MPLPVPVDLDWGTPALSGGLQASARNLPDGWQRGIAFNDLSCLTPTVMGECPSGDNLKPGQRPESATFRPFSVISAVECTVAGAFNTADATVDVLDRTIDFAVAREMLTGAASARDSSTPDHDNPSLVGTAYDLGADYDTLGQALSCLEANLYSASAGRGGYVLAGIELVTALKDAGLIWRDGSRWRTAAGSAVVVSAGFDGRAPGSDGPAETGDPLYLYAVTGLWVAVGQRVTFSDVNRSVNTSTSRSEELALAAFAPCAVYAAASPAVTRCEIINPPPEPEPVPEPAVLAVDPDTGTTEGGTDITVTGAGFMEGN